MKNISSQTCTKSKHSCDIKLFNSADHLKNIGLQTCTKSNYFGDINSRINSLIVLIISKILVYKHVHIILYCIIYPLSSSVRNDKNGYLVHDPINSLEHYWMISIDINYFDNVHIFFFDLTRTLFDECQLCQCVNI